MECVVKETLKSLCCGYGWSYGVLWQFDQQNPMFLTLAEAYEDQISGLSLIDDMLLQVHFLGQGIIGEAAFTGKDQWIHLEAQNDSWMGSVSCQDNEVSAELCDQLAFGIKTVVAIQLESHGVVQFGSTKKMAESLKFTEKTKKTFLEKINASQANASVPLLYENYGSDDWVDLLFSNEIYACKDQVLGPSGISDKLMGEICDSVNISHPPVSISMMPQEPIEILSVNPEAVLSDMVSLEQIFPSEATFESPFILPPFQQDSHAASMYSIEELIDAENSTQVNSGLLVGNQMPEAAKSDIPEILSNANRPSALTNEWHVAQLDSIQHDLAVASKDEFSQLTCASSSLNQSLIGTPVLNLAQQVQGNITDTFNRETSSKLSDPILCLPKDLEGGKELSPHLQIYPLMVGSCVSGISELDAICVSRPRKGLFLELGLDKLLRETVQESASMDRSSYDDPYSTSKKRKTSGSQIQSEVFSCLGEKVGAFQHHHQKVTKLENLEFERDYIRNPQGGLWIDDSYSINDGSTSANKTQASKTQESTKSIKKRARPGESTRPRPKDRQLFQDRLGELRKMIPNTGKCSIDALLDCTIKHMLFLQNVTKHAEKLKRIADQKEKGSISKNNANGVTWAYEMCDQAVVCPIKVEDVDSSGQMQIEMLCENGGTFLEIADTIRGFGLCILSGSMADRKDKTWAHFIVEAGELSSVTRVDIFWSLAQHLQQSTTTSGINSINQLLIKVDYRTSGAQSDYRHQQNLPQPILIDARR